MSGRKILVLVVAIVGAVFLGLGFVLPYLARKGVYLPGALDNGKTVLDTVRGILDGLRGIFPNTAGLELVDKIIGYAQCAVEAAEQLYKASQINADERKDAAVQLVYDLLHTAGVETNDDIRKIVDGCIEAAVYTLPKEITLLDGIEQDIEIEIEESEDGQ